MKATKLLILTVFWIMLGNSPAAEAREHPSTRELPVKAELPAKTQLHALADNLVAVAADTGEFNTLITAIRAAGLEDKLASEGPYTIFAPTDAAFAKLQAGTLENLLQPANKAMLAGLLANHVVPGKILAADIKTMKATNISGRDLAIEAKDSHVTVNGAQVVKADLTAANGVIHAIDTVLVPRPGEKKPAADKPKDHPAH